MNTRHNLAAEEVAEQIESKIRQLLSQKSNAVKRAIENCSNYAVCVKEGTAEKRWVRRPDSPEWFASFYDGLISEEREYYSKVRILELANNKPKKFILVYGDLDDMTTERGTGPFESIDVAKSWFMSGGR